MEVCFVIVKKGDILSVIVKVEYGNVNVYMKIFEVNKLMFSYLDKIYFG